MQKIATYSGFVTAALADAAIFMTTTTYVQLVIAAILYIPLAYFAFTLFPRKTRGTDTYINPDQIDRLVDQIPPEHLESQGVEIVDIDKRAFLKLIGATGLSLFLYSLFTKRAEGLFLGRAADSGVTAIEDTSGNKINPAKHQPTDDYKISEVDYGIFTYYGFIDRVNGWFIMKEDVGAGSFRYIKGDGNFALNWDNRENLNYDYFNRVFPES